MKRRSVLGIDVGTTGTKAVVVEETGNVVARAYKEYSSLIVPRPGWLELDARQLWYAVCTVIREVTAISPHHHIAGLCLATMGDSFVPVNQKGEPLGNVILAADARSIAETDYLIQEVGHEKIYQITGMPPHPISTLTKVVWLKRHDLECFSKTHKFLCCEEYVINRLGLPPTTSYSNASRTLAFDIEKYTWSSEMLEAAEVSEEYFPRAVPSGTIIGEVPHATATELGLSDGVAVVAGGMDQACSFLGSNTLVDGDIQDSMGTVEAISIALDKTFIQKDIFHDLLRGHYSINCHVLPEKYFVMALVLSAGAILKWFKDTFLQEELRQAEKKGVNVYELLLEGASPEPTHLLLLPYFTGSGTPDMDPVATGVLMGLGLGSTKQDITKAIFQGIAHEIALNLGYLEQIGIPLEEMRCVGGGANSCYWLQMKADLLDKRVISFQDNEVAVLGAAILAGVGAGVWNSFEEATGTIVKTDKIFEPDKMYRHYYDEQKTIYRDLYRNVRTFFPRLQVLLDRQYTF